MGLRNRRTTQSCGLKTPLTLQALCDRLLAERGVKSRHLADEPLPRRIGLTLKKRPSSRGADRPDMKRHRHALAEISEARRSFAAGVHRRDLDQNQHDPPLRRAPRGRRLIAKCRTATGRPRHSSPRCATTASMRPACSTAPSTASVLAYVEQFLVPTLKPNDIVVLDNLGSHKGKAVRNAIQAAARVSCSCPNTRPTSTRSSSSSPSSKATSEKPRPNPRRHLRRHRPSPHNHPARGMRKLSQRAQVMRQPKCRRL